MSVLLSFSDRFIKKAAQKIHLTSLGMKMRRFIIILKKFINVKDIIAFFIAELPFNDD
jgi:hypothetical protein